MQLIADLHLHSKYSRAVSQKMDILEIGRWASKKGIDLVATGDWTHPLWLREIKANLKEDESGLLKLKDPSLEVEPPERFNLSRKESEVLFLLSTEISSIYTQGGKQRRIHNLVFAPSISTVEKINKELAKRGANLLSDGRPILGLSAKDLTELVLGVDQRCLIVCAHIWTPWFSLFGSMSGFDSIEECFGKTSKYIYGIETGLSSDPAMNWRIKELDNRAILSFSDAHSGPKLGREVTVFEIPEGKLSYEMIRRAVVGNGKEASLGKAIGLGDEKKDLTLIQRLNRPPNPSPISLPKIGYTIEFYPEEGKYHYTGHRNCQVRQSPEETKKLGKICPVCGRPLTVGVMHRVEQLAVRPLKTEDLKLKTDENRVRWIGYDDRPPYATLVTLLEILGEALGSTPTSFKVQNEYENLTAKLGGEFEVLLRAPIEEILKISNEKVADGIKKVRGGEIVVEPGYDGVFGTVKIWPSFAKASEDKPEKKQLSLF